MLIQEKINNTNEQIQFSAIQKLGGRDKINILVFNLDDISLFVVFKRVDDIDNEMRGNFNGFFTFSKL